MRRQFYIHTKKSLFVPNTCLDRPWDNSTALVSNTGTDMQSVSRVRSRPTDSQNIQITMKTYLIHVHCEIYGKNVERGGQLSNLRCHQAASPPLHHGDVENHRPILVDLKTSKTGRRNKAGVWCSSPRKM